MLRTLIEKLKKPSTSILVAQLNARLQPIHRGEFFEDPLNEALDRAALGGQISGGGTLQDVTGEIEYCDIEIQIAGEVREVVKYIIDTLESSGAPKGSSCTSRPSPGRSPLAGLRAGGLFERHRSTRSSLARMRLKLRSQ
jgi:hypothetical protein